MPIPTPEEILSQIHAITEEIADLRHEIHAYPELGFEEVETSRKVLEQLSTLEGFEIREGIAKTGIVATLGADKSGACIGLRADMDCLPIEDTTGTPWFSKRPGLSHACGHDGHTAALVGAAKILSRYQDQLPGPVKFIFQPAEERLGGGHHMVEEGALKNPDVAAIFGLHGWPYLPFGTVGHRRGPLMASSDSFRITIKGIGSHGAYPHLSIDPIVVATQVIQALQTLVSRRTDPLDSAVVTVGQIQSSGTYNIIAEECLLLGTIRALTAETRAFLHKEVKRVSESLCEAMGARAIVEIGQGYPVTSNHPAAASFFEDTFTHRMAGHLNMTTVNPTMGGEDFSFYGQVIPSNFVFLGVCPEGVDTPALLHQGNYDFPDLALPLAIQTHVELALNFKGLATGN